jgi:hypothetical protein
MTSVSATLKLLRSILRAHRGKGKQEIYEIYLEEMKKPENLAAQEASDRGWFNLNYNSCLRSIDPVLESKYEASKRETLKRDFKIRLMNQFMPNGKQLKECNKGEVRSFGSWYVELAGRMKSGQTVRDAFTEKKLFEIYHSLRRASGEEEDHVRR